MARALTIAIFVSLFSQRASANLQVFPTRLLLSDQLKGGTITLRHMGKKPAKYLITAVFYKMKIDGTVEKEENPVDNDRPALRMLSFSPQTVTVAPNTEQAVHVVFSPPRGLQEGEYRAHLHFEPEDIEEPETRAVAGADKVSMMLHTKVGVAIPVIYRRGHPTFETKLGNLQIVKSDRGPAFSVDMSSTGNAFPFGDFFIYFTPRSGEPRQVGVVRGVASYISKRAVTYPLDVPEELKLSNGKVRVEYRGFDEAGAVMYAEIDTMIN